MCFHILSKKEPYKKYKVTDKQKNVCIHGKYIETTVSRSHPKDYNTIIAIISFDG